MDRYRSHTVNCRSCSTALRRIQALRPWLWGALWGSAALVGISQFSWLGVLTALISAVLLRQTARWQQGLLAGDGQAPRNRAT